jgi:uncharacterized protein YndB with AHSA1/START domain
MSDRPSFFYAIYVGSGPDEVWHALTDADVSATYWGHRNVSDWEPGSRWEHQRTDGSGIADVAGVVVESAAPVRLVTTWEDPAADQPAEPTRVSFDIEPYGKIVRLTVTHENLPDQATRDVAAAGWAAVLSNLKTMLETGHPLPNPPWEMP